VGCIDMTQDWRHWLDCCAGGSFRIAYKQGFVGLAEICVSSDVELCSLELVTRTVYKLDIHVSVHHDYTRNIRK
jgi:hypothetical protein